ncbi:MULTISPECIES: quaternary ammonium compound efflux SMR transporter SugE [unclassified Neptuniibacter]|jgi:quaternary ammonium compound-resistance protein SugE|uniref:quaternary ammonium compound efflux SMR transporter SugE n=1 Tax=unclassified Neptuniibacter TaxID=2630693 RepID=UPI0026E1ACC5|nr:MULTISPECIES: quaternary ammonium compound efflux SMR transporter SugE [unclassified Neptuniibacter]MDO6513231.1 quaternary ammonium compound efflux SMR transporter SugE [Neptuniibacter sp. 2_MG-2023]MDO6592357.1 quaternary ammonium compound efflux SMR transporter SugE [Neptuniibacter sp. 1_MG-2023]
MHWFFLVLAGLLEIGWAIGLKYSEGFSKLWPSLGTVLALFASLLLLSFAMKALPVGTAYGVWVGIGALGTAILGIILFDESVNMLKLVSLGLICLGILGLKVAHS